MDAHDQKILERLSREGRCSASALSRALGLSVSAVIERIRKLEEGGVIRGYAAVLDRQLLGDGISAWLEIRLEHPRHYDAFAAGVREHPAVLACHYLTGDYDFLVHVTARDSAALEAVHRELADLPGVSSAKTHLVLKTVKEAF